MFLRVAVGGGVLLQIFVFVLLLGYGNKKHWYNILDMDILDDEQPALYPIFSGVFHCCLFGWLFGMAMQVWERIRVRAPRLFDFDEKTALDSGHHGVVMTVLTLLLAVCLVTYIVVQETSYFIVPPLYPGSLCGVVLLGLFALYLLFPFGVFFPTTRRKFSILIAQVLAAPWFGVKFIHIVVTDAFTSACLTLYDLEYSVCFIAFGEWLSTSQVQHGLQDTFCSGLNQTYLKPVMYMLPYWLRFLQCWYRVWATRKQGGWSHYQNYVNAGKYFSALMVVLTSTLHDDFNGTQKYAWTPWRFTWLTCVVIKTLYCYVWDVYMDWDLGKTTADRFFLRDKRLLWTPFYYFAMVSNFFARIAWSLAISPRQSPPEWSFWLACIEILRRGQWMIIRVENEHWQKLKANNKFEASAKQPFLDSPHMYIEGSKAEPAGNEVGGLINTEYTGDTA